MAKEPKLFAEIREAKARAEKAAKHAPQVPVGPIMSASVVTLETPNPPSNYIVKALDECTTAEQCQELLEHAEAHGYDRAGQTVQLIRARMKEFGKASKKRGGPR